MPDNVDMIHVLVGSNWFGIKSALDSLISEFKKANGDLAIERFDGNENDQNEFLTSINSVSLFAEKKLVVIENLSNYKDLVGDVNKFFDTVDESTTLIVVEKQIDKRSSYYKTLKKMNGFNEFNELNETELETWVIKFVEMSNGKISRHDSRYLLARVGPNQTIIERELTKLIAYDKNITQSTIDLLTNQTPTSKIFDLVDNAFNGRVEVALKIYDEQRMLKVEPQAIMGMLVWQMHLVAICCVTSKSVNEIVNVTGLKSFSINKAMQIAKKMQRSGVERFLDLLADIDALSKKQTYELDDALKMTIISLAN